MEPLPAAPEVDFAAKLLPDHVREWVQHDYYRHLPVESQPLDWRWRRITYLLRWNTRLQKGDDDWIRRGLLYVRCRDKAASRFQNRIAREFADLACGRSTMPPPRP
jgi:hypothetical protein